MIRSGNDSGQYTQNQPILNMQGSYQAGNTASRPISEVKQLWAELVLAWETSLEPSVTLRFFARVILRKVVALS